MLLKERIYSSFRLKFVFKLYFIQVLASLKLSREAHQGTDFSGNSQRKKDTFPGRFIL